MSDEDEFTPKLGKPKARGRGATRKYLSAVVAVAARAGVQKGARSRRFDGSRIGRGASTGRILARRDRLAAFRSRRAVVKMRLVRLGAAALPAARTHLRYIQRDGVTRDGGPGSLYSAHEDDADGRAFLERADGDRHQFRFIVSPEDADQYEDLKPLIRRVMTQMEQDLGTKLDWVAVDHFNTGLPHTHVVLRGKDDAGANLVIAREYISHGLRERVAELVTLDLGPRTTLEIEERLRHDIGAERLTAIDRRMLRDMADDRSIGTAIKDPFQQSLRIGRLQKLADLGLAEPIGGGRWQLAAGLEETLRTIGERSDIIRTMQREMTVLKLASAEQRIFDPGKDAAEPVVGRVLKRGFSDEINDRHYLLIDGIDGRTHYVDIGRAAAVEPLPAEAIVRVAPRSAGVREVDRTITEIAAANGGLYSIDLHLARDGSATERFAEAHVRRLEAIRRVTGGAQRRPDGSWTIAPDHLDRVAAYEARVARDAPVKVEMVALAPLEQLAGAEAATWLDRRIAGDDISPARDAGFGREVRQAEAVRRQWLVEQGLADEQGGSVRLRANALAVLQRRELLRIADQLSRELGLDYREAQRGQRIDGLLRRRVDAVSGKFALVERARDFTLVPWRPVFERQIGRAGSGILREGGISWTVGRGRGGPSIS